MAKSGIQHTNLDHSLEYIKIHGLQRSGTNYLSHLINENFQDVKALVNLGGWKHGCYMAPWAIGHEVHVIGILKSPYAWLTSVFKYWGPDKKLRIGPNLEGVSFDEFVRNRCYFERQRDIPFLMRAENPVQHWNNMNFHWSSIHMNQKKILMLKYETLLQDPQQIIKMLSEKLELKLKDSFQNCDETFTPSGENLKPSGQKFQADYYLNAEWKQHYTPELLQFVNEELDMDLMVHFEYDFMLPQDLEG